jgi:predicted RNase H-like HicB family nuclease
MKIKAVIHEAAEGGYWAKLPSLPGLYTQAETLDELEANPREAIALYLSDAGTGPAFHACFCWNGMLEHALVVERR